MANVVSTQEPQHELVVLQLYLDRTVSPEGSCVFKFEIPGQESPDLVVDCAQLGLPPTQRLVENYHYVGPHYTLPVPVIREIQNRFDGILGPDIPLWLKFADDSGNLPLIPWERLLQPHLHAPLLRLPYYVLNPFVSSSGHLNIVLCATRAVLHDTFPIKAYLNLLSRTILDALADGQRQPVVIHIFSDDITYKQLRHDLKDRLRIRDGSGVQLYNPADAPAYVSSGPLNTLRETHGSLSNPWFLWILDAFQNRSVDMLHFIGHGQLSTDLGSLLLEGVPDSDEDQNRSWQIGAQQLATLATYLGAWSVAFTSPRRNFSGSGLRLLTDQLARLLTGSVFLHEIKTDPTASVLAKTYRFLTDESCELVQASQAISLYCHPSRLKKFVPRLPISDQRILLDRYTLAKGATLEALQSPDNPPTWIASSQRYLEQSTAEMLKASKDFSIQDAVQQGVARALRFLSTTLEQHAAQQEVEIQRPQESQE